MNRNEVELLHNLARAHGVQIGYLGMDGSRREIAPGTIQKVLGTLGVEAGTASQIQQALEEHQKSDWQRCIPPAIVSWDGKPTSLEIRIPVRQEHLPARCELRLESGEKKSLDLALTNLRTIRNGEVGGESYLAKKIMLPSMPLGYHELIFAWGRTVCRGLVIAAPTASYSEPQQKKEWGLFLPMYAAKAEQDWGAGNFGDWKLLVNKVAEQGGNIVASTPLLAAFLDYPVCEPSPYSPASRLFWNDFYIDLSQAPELEACAPARQLVHGPLFHAQVTFARRENLIQYEEQALHRRKVLGLLSKCFFGRPSSRRKQFEAFCRERPDVEDYAEFRAACDRRRTGWCQWPERMRNGELRASDYSIQDKRLHLYAQFLAQEQMDEMMGLCKRKGVKFYLDLPVGVHPDGYDVWRQRDDFALGASVGAPPDPCFTKGQDWGFSPLHPRRLRKNGYEYFLRFLRFQMRHTGLLRIDHVMGLHRLYWVPKGSPASEGAYVSHPAEEWQAILSLESHRNRTVLAGENLGTVPPEVNEAMAKHRLRQTYVLQYELSPSPKQAAREPEKLSVASLNTHDMPTFRAFCEGLDIEERSKLGLIPRRDLPHEFMVRKSQVRALKSFLKRQGYLEESTADIRSLFEATLGWLAASRAEFVLVNAEDLWLEQNPQNVPGTSRERPNWRRRMRMGLEEMFRSPDVQRVFVELGRLRKQGGRNQQGAARSRK